MASKDFPWNMAIMNLFVQWKKRFEAYYQLKPDKYMCFRAGFLAGSLKRLSVDIPEPLKTEGKEKHEKKIPM